MSDFILATAFLEKCIDKDAEYSNDEYRVVCHIGWWYVWHGLRIVESIYSYAWVAVLVIFKTCSAPERVQPASYSQTARYMRVIEIKMGTWPNADPRGCTAWADPL